MSESQKSSGVKEPTNPKPSPASEGATRASRSSLSAIELADQVVLERMTNGRAEKPKTTQLPALVETSNLVSRVKSELGFRSKTDALKTIVEIGSAVLLERKAVKENGSSASNAN